MNKIPYILLICSIIGLLCSIFRKRTNAFKSNYDKKIGAYQKFTEACSDAITRHTSKTYKELNARALDILPLVDSSVARDMVQSIADMTEKQSRHSLDRTELRDICKVCVSALRDDLYRKPKKQKVEEKSE